MNDWTLEREREREVFIFLGVFPFLKIKGRRKESTNIQCVYLDAIKIQTIPSCVVVLSLLDSPVVSSSEFARQVEHLFLIYVGRTRPSIMQPSYTWRKTRRGN